MSETVRNTFCFVVGIVTVLVFVSSAKGQSEKLAAGPCGSLFGARICTAYRILAGKVTEFRLRVPVAAIEMAPANVPMVWPPKPDLNLRFAPIVERETGFTFASIYWEAGGHPPAAYMVPHFDFHFYFVPEQQVEEIDCKDTRKPKIALAGYTLPDVKVPQLGELVGLCVPAMGMHAAPNGDLSRKTPWEGSLLVGYNAGRPIFFEPMITRALLLRKYSFSLPIPPGIELTPHVRYPRRFRAVYLPKSKVYDLIFSY